MRRRELSISTVFDYRVPIEAQIPLVAEAGFTHISLAKPSHAGYLSKTGREQLRKLLKQHSLRVDTLHGASADEPDSIQTLSAMAEAATDLCVPVVVMHGGPFDFEEAELPSRLDTLLRVCKAITPVAEETGTVFALENVLPGPATNLVRQALPHLDPQHFGFCYDSAHDQIDGPNAFDLLIELCDRVVAVHLSDRVRPFVDHVIPGEGFIDWVTLAQVLRKSGFAGPLLLEVAVTHSVEKEVKRFLRLAYERGCWLYDQVFEGKTPC